MVVTGCSSGIGGAVAQKLAGAGASVTGIDRNPPKTDLAQFIETDLGNPKSTRRLRPACLRKYGPCSTAPGFRAAPPIPRRYSG